MARFARAGSHEPLMKLERPTPASSQCTAHLINAAFSDVLSAKPHDSKAVNNLAVSKRGESDYHDNFVDHLTTVSDKYSQRLALLSHLEKHLVQARAKALADDEKALVSMSDLYPGYNELNLPRGPSHFRKYLDEELLARNHLLVPSKYLPAQPEHHKPPQETPPSYLNTTLTALNHVYKTSASASTVAASQVHQPSKPVWQSTLSPEEREAEKVGLSNFNRKANFPRNSRYSKTKWSNTASSGPVRLKQSKQELNDCVSFVAEPEVVEFTDYSVGNTYETTLELKNVSAVSRQLRLVPLTSPFFRITPTYCPTDDGLIAPGLAASYLVSFTPDSLANYQNDLKFVTCNDEEIVVQLRSYRPPPVLNIPAVLEVGYCLAGGRKTCVMECVNSGGEGTFTLTQPSATDPTDETLPSELVLGPFTVSPVQFHLPANKGVVSLTLSFAPDKGAGEYLQDFDIVCDNGQTMRFSIRGVAQKLSVGCVSIGEQSAGISDEDDPTVTSTDCLAEKLVPTPALKFTPVNPCNRSTTTILVKNFSNVELSYCWRFYRPITEGPSWKRCHEDTPLVNKLVSSELTPFSVDPCEGNLVAKETKKFTFNFSPTKTGCYVDMGYLVLHGVDNNDPLDESGEDSRWLRLSHSEVAVLCVQCTGEARDYSLTVTPPALLIPYRLPLATDTKKQVKLSNRSLAAVYYQWSKYECATVSITVDPPYGHIEPGKHSDFDVCIYSRAEGHFSTTLFCNLENCDRTIPLYISGQVEGPVVSVSVSCLEFGLIPVGRTNTLSFRVISHTNCSLSYAVRQLVEGDRDGYIDIPCLNFTPPEGELVPHGSATVSVECASPGTTGRLRTLVQLSINGEPILYFWSFADLQRSNVSMSTTHLHMDKCYIGIEVSRELELSNRSPVPAQFTWSSRVGGEGMRVCVSPMTGRIGPQETATVTITATWSDMNPQAEAILCCDILDMQSPLFLQLTAEVLDLSVFYSQPLSLDFSTSNKLGVPVSKTLTVTNTSGIPATLEASVVNFPSATPPTPPTLPKPEESVSVKNSRGRALLSRTSNLLEKSSKQAKQATSDYSSLLLREGRGCCFVVEPPSTSLPPFTPVTLTLTAHSDMWGEYTDQLICKVPGLSDTVGDTVVPVSYGAVGCPIVFQSTATVGYTLARLGSHAPGANAVRRVLKMRNTSPVAIRVDWEMFNIIQNDDKYVDLLMAIGDPFPRVSCVLGSAHEPTTRPRPPSREYGVDLISRSESYLLHSEKSVVVDEPISSSESKLDTVTLDGDEPEDESPCTLISALIKPHEGVRSTDPFDIHPKQLVIPAHGVCSVEVVFHPSVKALNEMGPNLASYALGYFSLDNECPPNVTRKSGYDVEPLRIDVLADIEQARLSLHSDEDNGLNFSYPLSVLLEDNSNIPANEAVLTHHFTLLNPTTTRAVFKLATLTPKFTISNISLKKGIVCDSSQYITLKPKKSVSFNVSLTVCLDDGRQTTSDDSISFTDSLQVCYATGALQEFPLTSTILLPQLSMSVDQVDFSTIYIDSRPALATLLISNSSMSHAIWELNVPTELSEVVLVHPKCGLLPLHLSGGKVSTELIRIEFSPKLEFQYTGVLCLREVLTDTELTVAVSGVGSADEKYIPSHSS